MDIGEVVFFRVWVVYCVWIEGGYGVDSVG